MGKFISLTDFTGSRDLATDKFSEDVAAQYITEFESCYLIWMLGAELYKDFLADYDAPPENMPSEPRFTAIWNPILIDDGQCDIIKSDGIKEMLVGFVYWHFMRDNSQKKNVGGFYKNTQANSTPAMFSETNMYQCYNKSIEDYTAIQRYICLNPENYNYNKFNGQRKFKTSPA